MGLLILWSLLSFIIYRLTSHAPFAAVLEAVGVAALAAAYFLKRQLLEHALTNLLGKIALTDVFDNIVSSHMLDISGLIYYLSIAGVLLFLTVQSVEKRRWS